MVDVPKLRIQIEGMFDLGRVQHTANVRDRRGADS